MSSKVHYIWF